MRKPPKENAMSVTRRSSKKSISPQCVDDLGPVESSAYEHAINACSQLIEAINEAAFEIVSVLSSMSHFFSM